MALRNQGFEKALNLGESVDDRQILNNLAGGNIQADIALFRNNKRNTSSLLWKFNFNGSTITSNRFVFPTDVPFVYTGGDEVKVTGSSLGNLNTIATYYVVDLQVGLGTLRNQSAFGLALTKGGARIALGSIGGDITFIRKDEVTKENIFNIATPDTLEQGVSAEASTFAYNIGATFNDAFDTIDGNIDIANFLRTQKYVTNQSITTDKQVRLEGALVSQDPAGSNSTAANLALSKAPGVFITDPFSSLLDIQKTRAYSTNSQPWVEETGKLTTRSTQVNIGDLYFENGIKVDSFDGVEVLTGSVTEFTHKLPVKINGVEYFVLVRQVT
jgi:hypothetical protein